MQTLEQRVNFYQDAFRKPEIRFPLQQMLRVWLAVLAILIVLAVLDFSSVLALRNQVIKLETTQVRMGTAVQALTEQLGNLVADKALERQEAYLRESLQGKQMFLATLQGQGDSHQVHFSEVFGALSRMDVDALWLTRIQLQTPGLQLSLSGFTAQPKALPDYLATLNRETIFNGMSFRMLNLERAAEQSNYLTFSVSTQYEAQLQR